MKCVNVCPIMKWKLVVRMYIPLECPGEWILISRRCRRTFVRPSSRENSDTLNLSLFSLDLPPPPPPFLLLAIFERLYAIDTHPPLTFGHLLNVRNVAPKVGVNATNYKRLRTPKHRPLNMWCVYALPASSLEKLVEIEWSEREKRSNEHVVPPNPQRPEGNEMNAARSLPIALAFVDDWFPKASLSRLIHCLKQFAFRWTITRIFDIFRSRDQTKICVNRRWVTRNSLDASSFGGTFVIGPSQNGFTQEGASQICRSWKACLMKWMKWVAHLLLDGFVSA